MVEPSTEKLSNFQSNAWTEQDGQRKLEYCIEALERALGDII